MKLSGVWDIVFVSLMIVLFPPEGFLFANSDPDIDHGISVEMNRQIRSIFEGVQPHEKACGY